MAHFTPKMAPLRPKISLIFTSFSELSTTYCGPTPFLIMFGIMALAGALLVAINRFDGGINVDANLSIL
jgi:hypothetical protein